MGLLVIDFVDACACSDEECEIVGVDVFELAVAWMFVWTRGAPLQRPRA